MRLRVKRRLAAVPQPRVQKIFKKTVTFSVFADYIYRTFNKSKICIFARFIYTFAFAVFRSGVLRYNFCARQTTAPVQPHCILNLTTSTLNSYKSAAAGGHPLPLCALSGYENNNLRAGKERQPLCGQVNLQKNKMVDMIITLRYNKAVKSGIENI